MAFKSPVDIANRCLQTLGKPHIADFTDQSEEAHETDAAYDVLRLDELSNNLWAFATRRVILRAVGIDSVIWTPPTWAAGTFSVGSIAAYTPALGVYSDSVGYWQATVAKTSSNTTTPDQDADWKHYTGPVAIDLYDAGTTYFAGEIVLVPAAWSGATTYAVNAVVRSSTTWYVSLADTNLNNAVTDTTWWVEWTGQGRGRGDFGLTAEGSPLPLTYPGTPAIYLSLYNGNADNPVSATINWLALTGTVAAINIVYPIGAGPAADIRTKNVFHLPNGFLRRAPTDPKGNQMPYLGAASGVAPEDWVPEGEYLISGDAGAITLRFVADVTDVSQMDPTFCEGLAQRMATELVTSLHADDKAITRAEKGYRRTMTNARQINAIEVGPISPVENRYVLVRI